MSSTDVPGSGAGRHAGPARISLGWPVAAWAVAAIGLGLGIATQLGQSVLPDGWSQIANSISPWLLVAFLVGAALPSARWAALSGAAILLLALVGYYGAVFLRYGFGGGTTSLALWSIGAVVGGPVFGWAGNWWIDPRRWRRGAATGLMASAPIAEGWYLRGILPDAAVGTAFIAVGLVLPILLGRTWRDRGAGYLAAVPGMALGALGYLAFEAVHAVLVNTV